MGTKGTRRLHNSQRLLSRKSPGIRNPERDELKCEQDAFTKKEE